MTAAPRQRPRTCVACREESPKRALIRVVRSPSGDVVFDERGKLPGRGAYLCASLECVEKARKTRALSRSLKTEIGADIYDKLAVYISEYAACDREDGAQVEKELGLLLGLARRANLLYIGIDSVKSNSDGESLLILTAADCSDSVRGAARNQAEGGKHVHLDTAMSVLALSSAIGAERVQALALLNRSGLTDKIKMLIFGQQRGSSVMEGRIALEQNESV